MLPYGRLRLCTRFSLDTARKSSSRASDLLAGLNAEITEGGVVPPFKLAPVFRERVAVHDSHGKIGYESLFRSAKLLSSQIGQELHGKRQKTISYLCDGDSTHIITQWAIWMSGNIAVPLCLQHPPPLLEYFIADSGTSLIICDQKYRGRLPESCSSNVRILSFPSPLHIQIEDTETNRDNIDYFEDIPSGKFYANSDAMILYTSGTTSKPKGVVHGFKQLAAQISSLHTAWKYTANDVLLHCLPLHHIHGQVNSVACTLTSGGMLRMISSFNPATVWSHLLGMEKDTHRRVSVFMGVPTMYNKLIDEYDKVLAKKSSQKEYIKNVLMMKIRLMVSGSAPLPVPTFQRWEDISGHRLLERYGMTEIGMGISNPYHPTHERMSGFIGLPLPGVSIQIASIDLKKNVTPLVTLEMPSSSLQIDLQQYNVSSESDQKMKNLFKIENNQEKITKKCKITYHGDKKQDTILSGDLLVKSNSLFSRYWNNPEHTKSHFTDDNWFITGDMAALENGAVKILGRSSVDIIKSGGFKISALEVETLILGHPNIADAAVLGLPDITWGERVIAVVELHEGTSLTSKELQEWGLKFVPRYQLPTNLYVVSKIQRNLMGKVNKKELKETLLRKLL